MKKTNNIPEYLLCPTSDLARQVLEKIERESDLRWILTHKKPTRIPVNEIDSYPELVLEAKDGFLCACPKDFYKSCGITNFTKAEDFLLSDETKIRLQELDNKLDKLINDMTNKTWDNLAECDSIVSDEGDVYRVVGVCGQMVFMLDNDNEIQYDHKYNLINNGYKIKGASEENKNLKEAILYLERIPVDFYGSSDRTNLCKAIEMLKKLK